MPYLRRLSLQSLRNLVEVHIELSPQFNVLLGPNGSGKTSLLEGIQLLSQGRSFRTHLNHRLIQHDQSKLTAFAELCDGQTLGLEKVRQGKARIKHNGCEVVSIAPLARELPVQLIHPDRFRLVADGAQHRRQFMDWGLFHVEHQFYPHWQQYQAALQQRNAGLKQRLDHGQIRAWDQHMLPLAETLHQQRSQFAEHLQQALEEFLPLLLPFGVQLIYEPGWDLEVGLATLWQRGHECDQQHGYTRYGPHRADLKMLVHEQPVSAVLSRGQQKLLVAALTLTQANMLYQATSRKCVFLIDDLAAELDEQSREKLFGVLVDMQLQIFITGIEQNPLDALQQMGQVALFHVEHGHVSRTQR